MEKHAGNPLVGVAISSKDYTLNPKRPLFLSHFVRPRGAVLAGLRLLGF